VAPLWCGRGGESFAGEAVVHQANERFQPGFTPVVSIEFVRSLRQRAVSSLVFAAASDTLPEEGSTGPASAQPSVGRRAQSCRELFRVMAALPRRLVDVGREFSLRAGCARGTRIGGSITNAGRECRARLTPTPARRAPVRSISRTFQAPPPPRSRLERIPGFPRAAARCRCRPDSPPAQAAHETAKPPRGPNSRRIVRLRCSRDGLPRIARGLRFTGPTGQAVPFYVSLRDSASDRSSHSLAAVLARRRRPAHREGSRGAHEPPCAHDG